MSNVLLSKSAILLSTMATLEMERKGSLSPILGNRLIKEISDLSFEKAGVTITQEERNGEMIITLRDGSTKAINSAEEFSEYMEGLEKTITLGPLVDLPTEQRIRKLAEMLKDDQDVLEVQDKARLDMNQELVIACSILLMNKNNEPKH